MLRPDTQRLWDFLKAEPALAGFILVGGTALSMHLNHRLSEDLDFMVPRSRLPRSAIEVLKRKASFAGFPFVANDSAEGLAEFEDTGMDYLDFQQDYIAAETIKVTFVAPDPEVGLQLHEGYPDRPRVASLEEIFALKCIACANRSKSRDWLDLYLLLRDGLFRPMDIYGAFKRANVLSKYDIAMSRMCSGRPSLYDEGYQALLPNPPSIDEMARFFSQVRDDNEAEITKMRLIERSMGGRQR